MTGILIAVVLAICVLITNYVAVRVTLHPAETNSQKAEHKSIILIVGFLTVSLIGAQAYRSLLSDQDLKHLLSQEETDLRAIKEDSKRPIHITLPLVAAIQIWEESRIENTRSPIVD